MLVQKSCSSYFAVDPKVAKNSTAVNGAAIQILLEFQTGVDLMKVFTKRELDHGSNDEPTVVKPYLDSWDSSQLDLGVHRDLPRGTDRKGLWQGLHARGPYVRMLEQPGCEGLSILTIRVLLSDGTTRSRFPREFANFVKNDSFRRQEAFFGEKICRAGNERLHLAAEKPSV